jgi:hypothetical protein
MTEGNLPDWPVPVFDPLETAVYACSVGTTEWRPVALEEFALFQSRGGTLSQWTGDIHLAVIVFDDAGRVANIIPHLYRLDDKGKRTPYDVLSKDERAETSAVFDRLALKSTLSDEEKAEWTAVHEREWERLLPPGFQIAALIRAMCRGLAPDPAGAVHHVLREADIEPSAWRRLSGTR